MKTNFDPLRKRAQMAVIALITVCSSALWLSLQPVTIHSDGPSVRIPLSGSRTLLGHTTILLRVVAALLAGWILLAVFVSLVDALTERLSRLNRLPAELRVQTDRGSKRAWCPSTIRRLAATAVGSALTISSFTGAALAAEPPGSPSMSPSTSTSMSLAMPFTMPLAMPTTIVSQRAQKGEPKPEKEKVSSVVTSDAGDVTNGQRWPKLPPLPSDTEVPSEPTSGLSSPTTASTLGPLGIPRTPIHPAFTAPEVTPVTTGAPTFMAVPTSGASTSTPKSTSTSNPTPTSNPTSTTSTTTVTINYEPAASISATNRIDPAPINSTGSTPLGSNSVTDRKIVVAGESFWSIAEDIVVARFPNASDRQIASYWKQLIALNASRLPAPFAPDLLFPGTELLLPSSSN